MATTVPTIPAMPAGYIATAADFNNLAYAAQFLLNRPMARISDTGAGTAILTTATLIVYGQADYDPDGMWNAGTPTLLTVQTPGFYRLDYMVSTTNASNIQHVISYARITTGSNNPAGSGVQNPCWMGYVSGNVGGNRACPRASGVIPWFMYPGDYVQVLAAASNAGQTTTISGFVASYLELELVST